MARFIKIEGETCKIQNLELNDVLTINGMKNVGMKSISVLNQPGSTTLFAKTVMAPDGSIAPHTSEHTVWIQIVSGSGVITLIGEQFTQELDVGEEDSILFVPPMIPHGYRAGKDGMSYLAVSIVK